MRNFGGSLAVLFGAMLALAVLPALGGEEVKTLQLDNEVVCRVNTEAISKRDVEDRMEEIAIRLRMMQKALEDANQWNADNEKKWNEMYIPAFRDALRRVVRERLLLQAAKTESVKIDERQYEKRYLETLKRLKEQGSMGKDGFTPPEVQKRIRDNMMMDGFRSKFYNILEQPSRPEVEKFYRENQNRYQRQAGVKVRVIKIDRFITDKFTGKQSIRENSYELAEELRKDIVKYGASFAEVAKQHSDDLDSRPRGGLVMIDKRDEFIQPDSYNKQLANAINGLNVGEVSKVFEFGQTSWAIAMVDAVRAAGPAPLDDQLYDEIYRTLSDQKSRKKEDEWFRKALSRSLVVHVVEGSPKQLPVDFFFPEEKEANAKPVANP